MLAVNHNSLSSLTQTEDYFDNYSAQIVAAVTTKNPALFRNEVISDPVYIFLQHDYTVKLCQLPLCLDFHYHDFRLKSTI